MGRLDRRRAFDALIAAAIATYSVVEVFVEHLHPEWVAAPLTALGCSALYWRRTFPVLAGAALVATAIAEAAAGVSLHTSVGPVIGVFFASWAIGAYETRPRAVLGLTLLVCGMWVAIGIDVLHGTDRYSGTDVPWIGALVATPGVLGIAFGARTRSLQAAEAKAARLELERREAIAEERARIARELHDVIAHSVSVMTVQAGAAEAMLQRDPALALEPVRAVQETGRQAMVEMKRLVGILREHDDETGLAPQPGLADLDRLVAQVREAGLPVEVAIEGRPRELPLGVDLSAYRVVQEALTNALKYAGTAHASVTVRYGADDLAIEVTDDGRGGTSDNGSGHGLIGMRERVGVFGGTFAAGPRDGGGFSVSARLPLGGAA
ncbi:MAG TPA: sensor histidine kinase [Gaiellaceae bacterium]|nr:sensor histidine kinase [Gaiellaceae bacterium]